jgi:hypothetical membrane protein
MKETIDVEFCFLYPNIYLPFFSTDPMSTLDLGSDVKVKGTIWASSFIAHGVLGALISAFLVTGKDMNE